MRSHKSGASDPFLDLVALAQNAALDPGLWPEAAVRISRAFDGSTVAFGAVERSGTSALEVLSEELKDPRLFHERYMTPETNPGLLFCATMPPLSLHMREHVVSDRELVKLDFYNDVLRPAGLWHAIGVNLHRDQTYLVPMDVLRRRSQRPFDDGDLRKLRRLAPHVSLAIRVNLRLRDMEAQAEAAREMSDRASLGMVLTDRFGRVGQANRLARDILDEADGLMIRDGVLRAAAPADRLRLSRLIGEAAGGAAASRLLRPSGAMSASRRWPRRPLPIVVGPTRAAGSLGARDHAVCISFSDPDRLAEADPEMLARLYGLTKREAAIAVLLLQGRSPAEAAAALAMTMNTMRTHIRHVLAKAGVDRLSELMRVLLRGPGVGLL